MIAVSDQQGQVFPCQHGDEVDRQHPDASEGVLADRSDIVQGKHIHQKMIQIFMGESACQKTVILSVDRNGVVGHRHFTGIQPVGTDHQKDQYIDQNQ